MQKDIKDNNIEFVPCNLCGANIYQIVYEGIPDEKGSPIDKYKSSGNKISQDRIVKCEKCNLVYVNPRLKPGVIVKGYSEGSDEVFVSQVNGREITFNKSLNFIEKFSKPGKILDIGTAGGSFLYVAKKRGWEVYGIEPNKWLCNWGKENYGIDIKPGTIFDYKYPNDFFDVVTLWDVLEHVPDPKKVLDECNRILRSGGLLVVNYPDIDSLVARIMKKKWVFLLSVHLFYFTPDTISKILSKTEFKIVKIKKHFQTLSLGYILFRMEPYIKSLSHIAENVASALKLSNIQIPYWMGQTLVLARKK
jgi:2-polyprenyl-3-methyl-5-hydroxy-6-metoxy-1,4-benzoquinol methylase